MIVLEIGTFILVVASAFVAGVLTGAYVRFSKKKKDVDNINTSKKTK